MRRIVHLRDLLSPKRFPANPRRPKLPRRIIGEAMELVEAEEAAILAAVDSRLHLVPQAEAGKST